MVVMYFVIIRECTYSPVAFHSFNKLDISVEVGTLLIIHMLSFILIKMTPKRLHCDLALTQNIVYVVT